MYDGCRELEEGVKRRIWRREENLRREETREEEGKGREENCSILSPNFDEEMSSFLLQDGLINNFNPKLEAWKSYYCINNITDDSVERITAKQQYF